MVRDAFNSMRTINSKSEHWHFFATDVKRLNICGPGASELVTPRSSWRGTEMYSSGRKAK